MTPTDIYIRPVELLQHLIRFDTTNPPGNERECVVYIDSLLKSLGIETTILAKDPNRPNLLARIKGDGDAPPLLLQGHVDVVNTAGQKWTHPPFNADIVEGFVWGRGTLDMKGGVAMMLSAFMKAKAENTSLPGDVILCILSDEENNGDYGARFLVEQHPEQFDGVKYAIGESGGYATTIAGKRFYPIMVAEKQCCLVRAKVRGTAGHGALPIRGGAMAKLGKMLTTLDQQRLPVHIIPIAKQMIATLADHLPAPMDDLLRQMLDADHTDAILDGMGDNGRIYNPLLHNTVSPTIVHAGSKINVIPAEVTLEMDGRILPGFTAEDFQHELQTLLGDDVEIVIDMLDPTSKLPDPHYYDMLAEIIREADPEGIPLPQMLSAVTDGRLFAKIGIQTYGFTPMNLPPELSYAQSIHNVDERIPVSAVQFGTDAIFKALQRYGR